MESSSAVVNHFPADNPMHTLERVFVEQQPSVVTMPSGRLLYCGISPDALRIEDHDSQTKFSVHYSSIRGDRAVMNANIRVKDINGQRNTDLYAGLLLRRSLDYFDANNPQPVSAFKALWVSNQDPRHASDNYKQYRAALNADPSNSWAAKGRAARSTWTGEQMNDMGFDLITSIHTDKKGNVCTVFERSSVLRGIYAWTSRQRSKLYQS